MTTDRTEIGQRTLPDNISTVMLRLAGTEGKIPTADIMDHADNFVLHDADGTERPCLTWVIRQFKTGTGSGFPELAEEQDFFDLLFEIGDKGENALAGARLEVKSEAGSAFIPLDGVSREKPEA